MSDPSHPSPSEAQVSRLAARGVPVESLVDACRACSADCDDADVDPYPKGFDVDLESDMLGSFKGFARQVVISTGKADWEREVTDETASLAQLIRDEFAATEAAAEAKPSFLNKLARKFSSSVSLSNENKDEAEQVPGVHTSIVRGPTENRNLSILNSSFVSSSHEGHRESVMVFPDWKVVHDVEATKEHAREIVEKHLSLDNDQRIGRARDDESASSHLKTWPLPYRAVVLLCSHKKRDRRCHIAAPLLANQFHHHLARHDLVVDERGEDLESGPPVEEWDGTDEEKRVKFEQLLRQNDERVGVFKVSHIGGHKFSGNVVIQFPNGTCIYYGRVTPADVGVIVERTILQGKVIPEFLRGGLGIDGKRGADGVLEW